MHKPVEMLGDEIKNSGTNLSDDLNSIVKDMTKWGRNKKDASSDISHGRKRLVGIVEEIKTDRNVQKMQKTLADAFRKKIEQTMQKMEEAKQMDMGEAFPAEEEMSTDFDKIDIRNPEGESK